MHVLVGQPAVVVGDAQLRARIHERAVAVSDAIADSRQQALRRRVGLHPQRLHDEAVVHEAAACRSLAAGHHVGARVVATRDDSVVGRQLDEQPSCNVLGSGRLDDAARAQPVECCVGSLAHYGQHRVRIAGTVLLRNKRPRARPPRGDQAVSLAVRHQLRQLLLVHALVVANGSEREEVVPAKVHVLNDVLDLLGGVVVVLVVLVRLGGGGKREQQEALFLTARLALGEELARAVPHRRRAAHVVRPTLRLVGGRFPLFDLEGVKIGRLLCSVQGRAFFAGGSLLPPSPRAAAAPPRFDFLPSIFSEASRKPQI